MKKEKNGLISLKALAKAFLLVATSVFLSTSSTYCQDYDPFNKGKTFKDLVDIHQITNLKSGLILTGERNDTIFGLFYKTDVNNLICVPLGRMFSDEYFVYENDVNSFQQLRETSRILTSKMVASYSKKKEQIFIIKQTLAAHETLRLGQDFMDRIYERILYYSKTRGIYNSEYMEKPDLHDPYFNWPYLEGDFIF